MPLLLIIAFISGLVTILAPCIWPLLPIILSTSVGASRAKSFGITLGIIASFGVFTLTVSYLVSVLKFDPEILRYFAVFVIGFLGLTLVLPPLSRYLEAQVSKLSGKFGAGANSQGKTGFWGGLTVGLALGIVWTPCAGPILAAIATLAATRAVNAGIVLVTVVYLIGIAIPLFFFSVASSSVFQKAKIFNKYTGRIQQVFGVVMIIVALLIFKGWDRTLQAKLLDVFPSYSGFLSDIGNSDAVRKELDKLKEDRNEDDGDGSGKSDLKVLGNAPDFVGIEKWLNSEPLSIDDLRGKVVLVDFWTYTCINCIRTLPYVTSWYDKYHDQGFVVVGVHTPEFEFEKKTENVQNAIERYKINYPVAQDNDFRTWDNYDNRYWPAKYLIDANGKIRYTHFGEGKYEETEKNIQSLLAEMGSSVSEDLTREDGRALLAIGSPPTPETYLGIARLNELQFASKESPFRGTRAYSLEQSLKKDQFAYIGTWMLSDEYAMASEGSALELNFLAQNVFLVIKPSAVGQKIKVILDGKEIAADESASDDVDSVITLDEERLYNIVEFEQKQNRKLRLEFLDNGIEVYAFTFG